MTGEEAIARAAACTPVFTEITDPHDPQGLKPGMSVTISPDLDGGEQPTSGVVAAVNAQTIVLRRSDPDIGELHVHFPRAGYKVNEMHSG